MAGILAELWRPRNMRPRVESQVFPSYSLDRKVLELETAKEILREVFGTTSAEVEEMIRLRLAEQGVL
jgi:hypothetical protein